ncbi:MAG: alpha/beta hydrolase domain-containing protein [Myxococcota bacterium]
MLRFLLAPRGASPCATLLLAMLLSSCGDGAGEPTAELEELDGENDPFIASARGLVVPDGYVVHEYAAEGTATDYAEEGTLDADGHWTFAPDTSAAYRTRVLVRRPADPEAMSGTVVVEWLNVSGGADADPVFTNLAEEIARNGHVWVGVSAQIVGVEGGEALLGMGEAEGLVGTDPERYGTLVHPGDGYSFDIFTQVARALRQGGAALGGERPAAVIAAGQSQSAFALTTYYNGVQPLTHAFDGFFVQSRAAGALPLVDPGESISLPSVLTSTVHPVFRDDLDAPVMVLQAEGDVAGILNSFAARQPDGDRLRLWEVAGTAHADTHMVGELGDTFDCGVPINDGPMHLVAKAAFHGLETWVRTETPPPSAERIEVEPSGPEVLRDADGIALGGIRTPPVDVPVDVLSGEPGTDGDTTCILFGSTTPLPDARIAELYPSRADYEGQYEASADATIDAGFVLEDDRAALLDYAQPERVDP